MIFAAKNEDDESTCDLVLSGEKTVTRRKIGGRVYEVGKDYAVQRGRGKKQEGRIKILSRMTHNDWIKNQAIPGHLTIIGMPFLHKEARREGFKSWNGLLAYAIENKLDIMKTIRYEFELVN